MDNPGINIWSGCHGPEAALTNPTAIARRKGNLSRDYPVLFRGRVYRDAESAYRLNRKDLPFPAREELCFEIVQAKLCQYPELVTLLDERGGVPWLERCFHLTGAKSGNFRSWEGDGRESAFLRALIRAYESIKAGAKPDHAPRQMELF